MLDYLELIGCIIFAPFGVVLGFFVAMIPLAIYTKAVKCK